MSDANRTEARQGARYLFGLGVVGLLLAAYFVIVGFAKISADGSFGSAGSLVLGAFFAAAATRVLKLGREALSATSRPSANR